MQEEKIRSSWFRWVAVALALLIVGIRIRYINEPLENDLTIRFDYVVRHLHGSQYYTELIAFGPAGAFWINEIFIRIFGANAFTVFLIGCIFSLLTLQGVFLLARDWAGQLGAGIAAMIWTILSFGLATQANQPNTEAYILALVVWGFVALQKPQAVKGIDLFGICAGLLFFLATAIKHHMLFMPLLAFLGHGLVGWRPHKRTGGLNLRRWLVAAFVLVIAWLLLLGFYAMTGRFFIFFDGLLGQSLKYAGGNSGIIANLSSGLKPYYLIPAEQRPHLILYVMLALCIPLGLWKRQFTIVLLLVGWSIGVWLAIAIPGRGYPHYFTLWHALLAIGAGYFFALVKDMLPSKYGGACAIIAAVFVFGFFCFRIPEVWNNKAEQAVYLKYGKVLGSRFTEARQVGLYLREHDPALTVTELGASGLHFWSNHLPPAPFVDSLYAGESQLGELYLAKMTAQLVDEPADWLVVWRELLRPANKDPRAFLVRKITTKHEYIERTDLSGNALVVLRLTKRNR
ncbi:ArnT family glycosyltransferase [Roseateles sp.]|uniref:ArnT family glycosyltransferase n=1 Tax=Roseateles sp. TaxID=1971397 RepID=UPI00286ACA25|nr:glycosyltransferase family 39 protein [Roseateles sp.]